MFNAKTVEGFVSAEEAEKIIKFAESIEPWEYGGSDFWDNRSLNAISIYKNHSKEMGELLYNLRERVREEIKKMYNLPAIYPDLFQIVRWYPGMEQTPHSDDMVYAKNEITQDQLEAFAHREFGSIIYLNNNYSGGHTFYPNHSVEIKPEVGKLAVHPGDPNHLHGVTKIEGATRYTIAAFWSQEEKHFDGWVL